MTMHTLEVVAVNAAERTLRGLRQLLSELELEEWRLDADGWRSVRDLLGRCVEALRAQDVQAASELPDLIRQLDPRRRIVPMRSDASIEVTADVLERRNVLVQEIEVLLTGEDDGSGRPE